MLRAGGTDLKLQQDFLRNMPVITPELLHLGPVSQALRWETSPLNLVRCAKSGDMPKEICYWIVAEVSLYTILTFPPLLFNNNKYFALLKWEAYDANFYGNPF